MRALPGIDFGKEANPMKYCMKCGKANTDADLFCAFCGEKLYSGDKIRHTRTQEQAQQPEAAFDPEPIPEKPETRRPVYTDNGKWPKRSIVMLAIASAAALGYMIYYIVSMNKNNSNGFSLFNIAFLLMLATVPAEFLIVCLTRKKQAALTAIPFIVICIPSVMMVIDSISHATKEFYHIDMTTVLLFLEIAAACIAYIIYTMTKKRGAAMPLSFIGICSAAAGFILHYAGSFFSTYLWAAHALHHSSYAKINGEAVTDSVVSKYFGASMEMLAAFIIFLLFLIGTAVNLWTLYKDRNCAAAAETPAA